MTQANVDVVRRIYEAWGRGDLGLEGFDSEVDLYQSDEVTGGKGSYHGHRGLAEVAADLLETFEQFHVVTEEVWDAGDKIVVFARLRGRGKGSGAPIDHPVGHVWELRDGKVVRWSGYLERRDALEAGGVRTPHKPAP